MQVINLYIYEPVVGTKVGMKTYSWARNIVLAEGEITKIGKASFTVTYQYSGNTHKAVFRATKYGGGYNAASAEPAVFLAAARWELMTPEMFADLKLKIEQDKCLDELKHAAWIASDSLAEFLKRQARNNGAGIDKDELTELHLALSNAVTKLLKV